MLSLHLHGEDNASAQNQASQSGSGASPKGSDFLFFGHTCNAMESISVLCFGFNRLHSGLDGVQRHGHVARAEVRTCRVQKVFMATRLTQ